MFNGLTKTWNNFKAMREINSVIMEDAGAASTNKKKGIFRRVDITWKAAFHRNYELEESNYAFSDIAAAFDVEGIFRRSVDKYVEIIWKNGFSFTGHNDKAVAYISKRFREIAKVTEKSTFNLFNDVAYQLVPYYNCFIVKVRGEAASSGNHRVTFYGKELKPVAGYFVLNTTEVSIVKDRDNVHKIIGYYQDYVAPNGDSQIRFYRKEDVIHIAIAKKDNVGFGTPAALPVLDDMRALRRMEENVEILVFQHSIPLYHYVVGDDNVHGDTDEVKEIETKINNMPAHGSFVTNERIKIEAVGGERNVITIDKYLEYFKQRIVIGLGQSSVGLGADSGANRATALLMERNTLNVASKFIKTIKDSVDFQMIEELLEEDAFDTDYTDENLVHLHVDEINIEDRIQKENHVTQLWLNDLVTREEARKEMGRNPLTKEQLKDTYWGALGLTKALIQTVDEPYMSRAGDVKSRPENQYGKKTGPTTPKNDARLKVIVHSFIDEMNKHLALAKDELILGIGDGTISDGGTSRTSLELSLTFLIDKLTPILIDSYLMGLDGKEPGSDIFDAHMKIIQAENIRRVKNFIDSTIRIMDTDLTMGSVVPIFEIKENEITGIAKNVVLFAYAIGTKVEKE